MKSAIVLVWLAMMYLHYANAAPLTGGISVTRSSHKHVDVSGLIGIREDWERKIVRIHPGSPAEKAGLEIGDKVLEVDGVLGADIAGPVGVPVRVRVQRIDSIVLQIVKGHKHTRCEYKYIDFTIDRVPKNKLNSYESPVQTPADPVG